RCWGTSLGSGSPWKVPTEIPALAGAERVSASWGFVCARGGGAWRCVDGSGPAATGFDAGDAAQLLFQDGQAGALTGRGDRAWRGDARPRASGATQLALGFKAGCALLSDHTVTCWQNADAAKAVTDLAGATQIAFTNQHACARIDDGSARCW